MSSQLGYLSVVRYRGFLLIPQTSNSWLVRPERSPMSLLPFRVRSGSLEAVKATLDMRLAEVLLITEAA